MPTPPALMDGPPTRHVCRSDCAEHVTPREWDCADCQSRCMVTPEDLLVHERTGLHFVTTRYECTSPYCGHYWFNLNGASR